MTASCKELRNILLHPYLPCGMTSDTKKGKLGVPEPRVVHSPKVSKEGVKRTDLRRRTATYGGINNRNSKEIYMPELEMQKGAGMLAHRLDFIFGKNIRST